MESQTPALENVGIYATPRAYIASSEVTGLPVIISPPGTPLITSEQVRTLLENFP